MSQAVNVTETGNGKLNVRSEVFVDAAAQPAVDTAVAGTILANDGSGAIVVDVPECELSVLIDGETMIVLADGMPGELADLVEGAGVGVTGTISREDGTLVAATITLVE